jgi:hypothetical protein
MAPKKPAKGTKTTAKKAKRLSLSKKTLKDLSGRGSGPKSGVAPGGKWRPGTWYTACIAAC